MPLPPASLPHNWIWTPQRLARAWVRVKGFLAPRGNVEAVEQIFDDERVHLQRMRDANRREPRPCLGTPISEKGFANMVDAVTGWLRDISGRVPALWLLKDITKRSSRGRWTHRCGQRKARALFKRFSVCYRAPSIRPNFVRDPLRAGARASNALTTADDAASRTARDITRLEGSGGRKIDNIVLGRTRALLLSRTHRMWMAIRDLEDRVDARVLLRALEEVEYAAASPLACLACPRCGSSCRRRRD